MSLSPSRLGRLLIWTPIAVCGVFAAAVCVREFASHLEQVAEQDARAASWGSESDRRVADALPKTTTLRVWAAGFRSSSGFCPPCSMFPPPTVLYESSDAREILEFGGILRFRRTSSGPEVANCGALTFDFVRGEEILHSFNYKSSRLTDESANHLEAWLKQRDIWSKREGLLKASMTGSLK